MSLAVNMIRMELCVGLLTHWRDIKGCDKKKERETGDRSWGWIDNDKIKGSHNGSRSQFTCVCVNPLIVQVLAFTPSAFWKPPVACVFLSSIMCDSSSLSKCQSKLLLFPDHAVGDRPTSSPWQPSVLAQRERQGRRRKELLCLWTPTCFLPLVLMHCSSGLDHVAKLPGFTVAREEEKKRGLSLRAFFKDLIWMWK